MGVAETYCFVVGGETFTGRAVGPQKKPPTEVLNRRAAGCTDVGEDRGYFLDDHYCRNCGRYENCKP